MVPLSPATEARLKRYFPPKAREEAARVLAEECGDNLPSCGDATPMTSERIRFAVVKLSCGSVTRLRAAVGLAKADWKDLLVVAGFGGSPLEHLRWKP
jgi:hypothetical protein